MEGGAHNQPNFSNFLWLKAAVRAKSWRAQWAATPHERLRKTVIVNAIMAAAYGLDLQDLKWILREVDYETDDLALASFRDGLDPKGFWRVGRESDPELRLSVLTIVALQDLTETLRCSATPIDGVFGWLASNGGEGWALPESLCLADYDLGHGKRAKRPQPVESRLGERFYPWQQEQSVEESWAECERHARNLLGADGYARLQAEIAGSGTRVSDATAPAAAGQRRLFAHERDLFGDRTEDLV